MNSKVIRTIYQTKEQAAGLEELHRTTRIPKSEFIREGIDLVLEKNKKLVEGDGKEGGGPDGRGALD